MTDVPEEAPRRRGRPAGSQNKATVAAKMRLSQLARVHSELALSTLAEIAEGGQSEAARITAACALLDRAYGRPPSANGWHFSEPSPLDDLLGAF